MGRKLGRLAVVGGVLGFVTAASAQSTGQLLHYNRPSAYGPSEQMGLIGGRYTRIQPPPLMGPATPQQRALGLPGWGVPRGTETGGYSPPMVPIGPIPSPGSPTLYRQGLLSDEQISLSSGFAYSVSAGVPLYGLPRHLAIRPESVPLLLTEKAPSQFHDFFGLRTAPEEAGGGGLSYEDLNTFLEQRNSDHVERLRERARLSFANATNPANPEELRAEYLRQAIAQLSNVRDLDPTDTVTRVLLAHAFLHRDFLVAASEALRAAVEIDPAVLRNPPEVAACYGDVTADGRSVMLEDQLRRIVRGIGDPPDLATAVLQGYCALLAGDTGRARQALERAEQSQRKADAVASPDAEQLLQALRYAL